jgi:hypothetical protein
MGWMIVSTRRTGRLAPCILGGRPDQRIPLPRGSPGVRDLLSGVRAVHDIKATDRGSRVRSPASDAGCAAAAARRPQVVAWDSRSRAPAVRRSEGSSRSRLFLRAPPPGGDARSSRSPGRPGEPGRTSARRPAPRRYCTQRAVAARTVREIFETAMNRWPRRRWRPWRR